MMSEFRTVELAPRRLPSVSLTVPFVPARRSMLAGDQTPHCGSLVDEP